MWLEDPQPGLWVSDCPPKISLFLVLECKGVAGAGCWSQHLALCCRKSSIIVAADESTISWGPSPTFGELVRIYGTLNCTILPLIFWSRGSACQPTTIFWGCACVFQGYGDHKPKSSTAAQEVKTLDGIYTEQVGRDPHTFVSPVVAGTISSSSHP